MNLYRIFTRSGQVRKKAIACVKMKAGTCVIEGTLGTLMEGKRLLAYVPVDAQQTQIFTF